jgi:hypothetical protein
MSRLEDRYFQVGQTPGFHCTVSLNLECILKRTNDHDNDDDKKAIIAEALPYITYDDAFRFDHLQ